MKPYIELLRLPHWVKNAAVLVALPFGWLQYGLSCTYLMLLAFCSFCLASSACYAINDVVDRREDLLHPKKKNRPVARGAVPPWAATLLGVLLLAGAVGIALLLPYPKFLACVLGYFALTMAYSLFLKREPILDVIVIASGFVIRTVAGAVAIDIFISEWLIVCTFTVCLFLGFGKRRSEIQTIANSEHANLHRPTLAHYSPDLLNQLLSTSAGIALLTFMLYIMDTHVRPEQVTFNKRPLLYTFPLVAYGLFRYAMLIETGKVAGPVDILLRDRTLLAISVIWVLTSAAIVLYRPLAAWLGLNP